MFTVCTLCYVCVVAVLLLCLSLTFSELFFYRLFWFMFCLHELIFFIIYSYIFFLSFDYFVWIAIWLLLFFRFHKRKNFFWCFFFLLLDFMLISVWRWSLWDFKKQTNPNIFSLYLALKHSPSKRKSLSKAVQRIPENEPDGHRKCFVSFSFNSVDNFF